MREQTSLTFYRFAYFGHLNCISKYLYLVACIPIDIDYHITIHTNNSTTSNTILESLIGYCKAYVR